MKRNVCGLDRVVRLTAGPGLLLLGYLLSRRSSRWSDHGAVSPWHLATTYAGAELLVTGLLQWCPGNYLLGIDTCERGTLATLRSAMPCRDRG